MGTNYYLYDRQTCLHCGKEPDPIHIGKSSYGWCFALHIIPEESINDLKDWEKLWGFPGAVIKDEYHREISTEGMKDIVTKRSYESTTSDRFSYYKNEEDFHKVNDSIMGPFGLCRAKLSSTCIKHGNGTWDCIKGEFS